ARRLASAAAPPRAISSRPSPAAPGAPAGCSANCSTRASAREEKRICHGEHGGGAERTRRRQENFVRVVFPRLTSFCCGTARSATHTTSGLYASRSRGFLAFLRVLRGSIFA